jgi:hypothetical protein
LPVVAYDGYIFLAAIMENTHSLEDHDFKPESTRDCLGPESDFEKENPSAVTEIVYDVCRRTMGRWRKDVSEQMI